MIGSGEAESRAVAGAVQSAIGQARLNAGVNITGLLVDMDSADSVDYRQHFMCWHPTSVLRPSVTEKVPPAVVRSVVDQEAVPPRIVSPSQMAWPVISSLDLSGMQLHGEVRGGSATDSDGAGTVGDSAGPGLQRSLHQELRRTASALLSRSPSLAEEARERGMIHRSLATPPSPPACRAASATWCLNLVRESALV